MQRVERGLSKFCLVKSIKIKTASVRGGGKAFFPSSGRYYRKERGLDKMLQKRPWITAGAKSLVGPEGMESAASAQCLAEMGP